MAGHRGLVGSALVRRLGRESDVELLTRTRSELDLLDQAAVHAWMAQARPDYIMMAAARVGGIHANNTWRADFIYENLVIAANVIHAAHEAGVQRMLFLGSSCIYPRECAQPMREEYLLSGPLEPTNEPYAVAKIAGIKLAEAFNAQHGRQYVSAMPTNLYGPGDNFDLETSHVLPALIRKIDTAKRDGAPTVTLWGTGTPRREFLYVDDLADACVFLMRAGVNEGLYNIGTGSDVTIRELAEVIAGIVGYDGEFVFDADKPDGTPQKLLDVSRLRKLGWVAPTSLPDGIRKTYDWYRRQREESQVAP